MISYGNIFVFKFDDTFSKSLGIILVFITELVLMSLWALCLINNLSLFIWDTEIVLLINNTFGFINLDSKLIALNLKLLCISQKKKKLSLRHRL